MAGVETGEPQPKVSALVYYQLAGFSVERLMEFIVALGCDVEIVVRPAPQFGGVYGAGDAEGFVGIISLQIDTA